MDGVLIDSQPIHFNTDMEVIKAAGANPEFSDVEQLAGVALGKRLSVYKNKYGLELSIEALTGLHVGILMRTFRESNLGPIKGIPKLLHKLKETNIKMAVASSSSLALIRLVLDMLNISEFFNALITGEEVENGKPAPDIFLKAAERLDSLPENCAVVEDSTNGVLAAKHAGMYCVAYENPTSGEQDLSNADMIINSFNSINNDLYWLEKQGAWNCTKK